MLVSQHSSRAFGLQQSTEGTDYLFRPSPQRQSKVFTAKKAVCPPAFHSPVSRHSPRAFARQRSPHTGRGNQTPSQRKRLSVPLAFHRRRRQLPTSPHKKNSQPHPCSPTPNTSPPS